MRFSCTIFVCIGAAGAAVAWPGASPEARCMSPRAFLSSPAMWAEVLRKLADVPTAGVSPLPMFVIFSGVEVDVSTGDGTCGWLERAGAQAFIKASGRAKRVICCRRFNCPASLTSIICNFT